MRQSAVLPEGRMLFSRLLRHTRLRQLHLLLALHECGSVVRAAQHLDISQSAATQALAELERVLDVRLFERHARGLRPTPAGQALTDAARGIMSELEDVAEALAALRLGASAALRLGAIEALGDARTPAAMSALQKLLEDRDKDVREAAARLYSRARRQTTSMSVPTVTDG